MNENEVMWIVVAALVVLIGLFISLATPLIKLNRTIQKLNDSIDRLNTDTKVINETVNRLDDKLATHDKWLLMDKKRLDNHEERLCKLDNNIGIKDKEHRL